MRVHLCVCVCSGVLPQHNSCHSVDHRTAPKPTWGAAKQTHRRQHLEAPQHTGGSKNGAQGADNTVIKHETTFSYRWGALQQNITVSPWQGPSGEAPVFIQTEQPPHFLFLGP